MAEQPTPVSVYTQIEDAIAGVLKPTGEDVEETPVFRRVVTRLGGLALADLADEMAKYGTANTSPAALILIAGGEGNGGRAGDLQEKLSIQIALVAAATSVASASVDIYRLLEVTRQRLHNVHGIAGIPNPLYYMGHGRLPLEAQPAGVAAIVAMFEASLHLPDGPDA